MHGPMPLLEAASPSPPRLIQAELGPSPRGSRAMDAAKPAPEPDTRALSDDGRRALQELKAVDQKVRAHEGAHRAAGAGLVRGGSFTYRKGPDGQMYAVGGEVVIDTSAVPDNPRATLAKMQQVQAAAMAPADPSPQDRAVAAQAAAMAARAMAELARAAPGQRLDQSA